MSRNQRVKAEAVPSGHRESCRYWENDLPGQGLSRRAVVMRASNKGSPKMTGQSQSTALCRKLDSDGVAGQRSIQHQNCTGMTNSKGSCIDRAGHYRPDPAYLLNSMQGMAQYFRSEHIQQGQYRASSMAARCAASGSGGGSDSSGVAGYSGRMISIHRNLTTLHDTGMTACAERLGRRPHAEPVWGFPFPKLAATN